jgi:superfamily II DNA helicase RecQ
MDEKDVWRDICDRFGYHTLNKEQCDVLRELVQGRDVFLSTKTSSGKSLSYQAFPIACSLLRQKAMKEISVFVIMPLLRLCIQNMDCLTKLGFSATYIGRDPAEDEAAMRGEFTFVFTTAENICTPESLKKWATHPF